MSRYYFAYGTNMEWDEMSLRCPGIDVVGTARLDDFRLIINGEGIATVIPAPGEVVWGVLWLITPACERSLDRYEGVDDRLYEKVVWLVRTAAGQDIEALLYVASDESLGVAYRTGYVEKIIRSAENASFPEPYIREIRKWLYTVSPVPNLVSTK